MGTVGVWSGVSHREDSWSSVSEGEVLVSELVSVDGFTSGTVVVGEITTLKYKILAKL